MRCHYLEIVKKLPKRWSPELKVYIHEENCESITFYKSDTHYLRVVCQFKVILSSPSLDTAEPGHVLKITRLDINSKMLARFFPPTWTSSLLGLFSFWWTYFKKSKSFARAPRDYN